MASKTHSSSLHVTHFHLHLTCTNFFLRNLSGILMTQGEMNGKPMVQKPSKPSTYYNKNKIREEWFPGISELYSVSPAREWQETGNRKKDLFFRSERKSIMVIYGVALLAGCYMAGNVIGDVLGALLGVKANIGGVGFAMLFLIIISSWAQQKGIMKAPEEQGIKWWSAMYIPVVVAMSSIQNVAAALSGGVVAILGGLLAVAIGFLMIPVLAGKKQKETVAEDSLAHSK